MVFTIYTVLQAEKVEKEKMKQVVLEIHERPEVGGGGNHGNVTCCGIHCIYCITGREGGEIEDEAGRVRDP